MKSKASKINARVEYMLNLRIPSKIINLPKNRRLYAKYDKALLITLHGEPISDSRPRYSNATDMFYNPHKAILMKLFGAIYNEDKLLQNMIILTPHAFVIRNYVVPSKKILRAFAKHDIANSEDVLCMKQKDNDNIEKVHFDVMQDIKYSVIIDDKLITHNMSSKFYSMDPRVEIEIQFPSEDSIKTNPEFGIYLDMTKQSAEYKKFCITKKYIFNILKTEYKSFPKVFFNTLSTMHVPEKQIRTILTTQYSADDISALCAYCRIKPSTRKVNMERLIEVITNDSFPVHRERSKDLMTKSIRLE